MKINWNRRYTTIAVYAFLVIAAALLLGLLLSGYFASFFQLLASVGKALLPFLYGFVLAFFTIPLTEKFDALIFRLSKKKKPESRGRRIVAMLLAYAVVLLVVIGLLLLIIPQLVDSIATLVSNFSTYTDRIREIVDNLSRGMSASSAEFWENMVTKGYAMLNDYLSNVVTKITSILPQIYNFTVSVVTVLVNFLIGFVISIYVTYDHKKFARQVKRVLACIFPERFCAWIYKIARRTGEVFNSFFIGKALDSLIVGVICFIFLLIMGMPYPILIAAIIAVTNMIPYFGPFIGTVPCALLIFLIDPLQTLWFVIFIIVLQQIDGNVIGPRIVGQSLGLPSFWVVFSLLLFGKLFGFVGMFIGSPVFAVIYSFLREWVSRREKTKQAAADEAAVPPSPEDPDGDPTLPGGDA